VVVSNSADGLDREVVVNEDNGVFAGFPGSFRDDRGLRCLVAEAGNCIVRDTTWKENIFWVFSRLTVQFPIILDNAQVAPSVSLYNPQANICFT